MKTKVALRDKLIAIVDLETTGLDPATHEIIQVAVRVMRPDGRIVEDYEVKVLPEHIETANKIALRVNKYSEEAWEDAIPLVDAMSTLRVLLKRRVICGQNVNFDLGFLYAAFKQVGLSPSWDRRFIDTMTLAYVNLVPLGLDKISLESTCDFLGISNEGAHDALVDVRRTYEVYLQLRNGLPWYRRLLLWHRQRCL